ncbi:ATP-dependent RNA helicase SUPV3L1/SUV3 [Devosia crocina]|uniref:ATP-dependent RNA helicase SUPV3L1/SUV3 n=1 Tax=Devosia crocina TaxID=429728 RepID=A0A1I7NQK4_9HYPH|nr:helicase-related protein [Devosia crocina]SFV36967.1 ATP-dependent RNA helicase SUPV3L1/SUV3 [Devosia crocina]
MTFSASQSVKAILGPTNTGKTHFAIERMLAHPTGMIGLPLRLLAREVYGRIVERVGEQAVALVTGEERIVPAKPRYWVATVEAMPMDIHVDCVAIDEIQTATDFDRGHVFTNRILHARGFHETLLLGSGTMANVIRKLLPHAEIIERPRFSQLMYAGSKKISRQPGRSAIVAFSARQVYAIAELIRRERGGAAVVMGALSPRTRNAQVELYQNGDVDFLVATDAIGMGLNLDIHHVAFADDTKFDGHQTRPLTPSEIGQIAGRAGRHKRDGTFGVTGGTDAFEEELIVQLETHDFEPVKVLQWRNSALDFSSIDRLRDSLEKTPDDRTLTRVPIATDQLALEFLSRNEAGALARGHEAVKLLWECCQTPDYQGISPAAHGEIVTRIFSDLRQKGTVNADWIAEQVRFCDNAEGDIETLSHRIRQIRTWTFVANRKNWLADPSHWREKTRDIEDRLSDALHERLTQRFVDRRTSVLLRHLKDKRMVSPEINSQGEVRLEGHLLGTLEGFRFTLARSDGDLDPKGIRSAADQVVAPEIRNRADRLAGAPNEEFVLATDGRLRWRGDVVAELAEGDSLYRPRIIILADESLTGPDLERVQDRLALWLRHHVNTTLEQVMALEAPADVDGPARGIAFQLFEHLGLLPRAQVADDVKGLDQDVRGKMRKLGIKFGAYHIYVPLSLKPAPRELALILFALKNGGIRQPGVTDIPHIVLSGRTSFLVDPEVDPRLYEIAGFKVAGKRAVRVDILERLADIIRPLIAIDPTRFQGEPPAGAAEGNGFRVTVEMTSLLGCSGEDFASILTSLGYRVRRTPKVVAPAAEASAEAPALEAVLTDNATEIAAPAEDAPQIAQAPAEEPALAEAPAADEGVVDEAKTAEATAPAEPEFDEIWFPGGRRHNDNNHNGRRPGNRRPDAAEGGEGKSEGRGRPDRSRPKGPRRPEGDGSAPNPNARPKNNEQRGRPANQRPRDENRQRPPREERKVAFDPDSPFAALAALRGKTE